MLTLSLVEVYSQENILPNALIKGDSVNKLLSRSNSFFKPQVLNKDSLIIIGSTFKKGSFKAVKTEIKNQISSESSIEQLKSFALIDSNKTGEFIRNIKESIVQKNIVSINNLTVSINKNLTSSSEFSNNYNNNSNYSLDAGITLATIPLQINTQDFSHLNLPGLDPLNSLNTYRINFDKDEYIATLKKKLKGKFNPQDLINKQVDILQSVKDQAMQLLKNDIEVIKKKYSTIEQSEVLQVLQSKNLFETDITSIAKQILPEANIEKGISEKNMLDQLQNKINNGLPIDRNTFDSLKLRIENHKGLEEIINKVNEHKSNWKKNGLIDKIAAFKNLYTENIKQIINNPESIKRLALDKLQLNKIQRFFLKVNKLNIGQNSLTTSKLSMNDLLSKNISSEFVKKNKYLSVITGKQSTVNSLNDLPFTDVINSANNNIKAFSYGKGDLSGTYRNISLIGFSQNKNLNDIFQSYSAPRSLMVGTVNNRWALGKNSFISTEVSRSSMQYSNEISSTGSSYSSSSSKAFQGLLRNDNIFNNMALSFAYQGELEDKDLFYSINAIAVSNGYNNPASSYLNNGKELDANIKKQFFKRKLQLSLRTSLRQYDYSLISNSKLNSSYYVYDIKWKFSKANFFAFRYQPSGSIKVDEGTRLPVSHLDRISFELNLNKRLAAKYYRNYLNLSYQNSHLSFNDLNKSDSKTISLNNVQNITMGSHLLYWNNNFNFLTSNTPSQFYLNSSVLSDLGITYTLLKTISGSSSFNYNSVKAWYNQIGVRQSVSGTIGNNLDLNIYVNIGKNLKLYQPALYSPVRGDLSIRYTLKKQK